VLFVVGSDDAQVLFCPDFDHIVLLSAPREVMVERLTSGQQRVRQEFPETREGTGRPETFEPFMRRDATYEIDATGLSTM
jgi:hypothetical protein